MELEEHQNSHTGDKPFECDVCNARFNRRSTLWNHKRIHSDNKPFNCPVCTMTFKWKNSLKCHKEMHLRKNETGNMDMEQLRQLTYASARRKQGSDSGTSRRSRKRRSGGNVVAGDQMSGASPSNCSMSNSSILQAALLSTPPPEQSVQHTTIQHTPLSTGSNHSSPPSDPAPNSSVDMKPLMTSTTTSQGQPAAAMLNTPTGPGRVLNLHIISTPHHTPAPTALLAPTQSQQYAHPMSFMSPTQAASANGLRSPVQPTVSSSVIGQHAFSGMPSGDYIPNVDLGFLHQQQFQMQNAGAYTQHMNQQMMSQPIAPHPTHQTAVVDGAYIVKVLPYTEW